MFCFSLGMPFRHCLFTVLCLDLGKQTSVRGKSLVRMHPVRSKTSYEPPEATTTYHEPPQATTTYHELPRPKNLSDRNTTSQKLRKTINHEPKIEKSYKNYKNCITLLSIVTFLIGKSRECVIKIVRMCHYKQYGNSPSN